MFDNIKFVPAEFINNLVYMAAGMFSIFAVIFTIIVVVYILNKLDSPKKNKDNQ